ncbi:MAG: penicillin-binding transpeptidase domain-containing protein [Thermoanaerobaculia bacterium]
MRGRLGLLLAAVALWLGVIVLRLVDLQLFGHREYLERAQRQQQRVVELDPPRGTIYDARGQKLAVSVQVRSAYAVPGQIADVDATAAALARVLGEDAEAFAGSLRRNREFVWIARKLDDPQAEEIRALDLPGIDFLEEAKRYYPNRELAAAVLGYVGTDNIGLGGVEAVYDAAVAGTPGKQTVLRDARRGTAVAPFLQRQAPQAGADLHLTLDATLQHVAERELTAAIERHRARGGTIVVLDPESGAVLAMASLPGFDPNHFTDYPRERWRNAAIMDAYEPGSTFKVVPVAAGLEHRLIDPMDTFDCEMGGYSVQGIRMRDHKPFGVLTVREILQKSSNVGAMKIGLLDGAERFFPQIEAFGFGRPTGIDLPGESPGLLMPLASWRPLTTANVAFGQGISVTPLQLAAAFGAIANGGRVLRPYVVEAIGHPGQLRRRQGPVERGRAISPATQLSLERMLESVVAEGTGKAAAIPGRQVAGKTGTAQKALPGRGYTSGYYVASFAGFAPARDPRVVAVVTVDEPRALGYHGGQVAAPIFAAVVGEALRLLGVPPTHHADEEQDDPPRKETFEEPEPPDLGPGWNRLAPPQIALKQQVEGGVPDFGGLTAREALVRAAAMGVEVRLLGDGGFVARQQPEPASPLPQTEEPVRLWLVPEPRATG